MGLGCHGNLLDSEEGAPHPVFSLSVGSVGKGTIPDRYFLKQLCSFSEPPRGCRW